MRSSHIRRFIHPSSFSSIRGLGFRLLGDSVDGKSVEDIEIGPRLQALMGQTSVREAREVVRAAAGASVATANQSVAAHAPGIAWATANLPGALQ